MTACPAGVNYARTVRDRARRGRAAAASTNTPHGSFWRALHAALALHATARCCARRASAAALSAQSASRRSCAASASHGCCRRLCAGSNRRRRASRRQFSNRADREARDCRTVPERYRVALLTGCVQDLVFSDVNRDTADVLLANGCEVITPPAQLCCGSLHAHNGEPDLAAQPGAPA